jgi:invasion protein IalB
MPVPYRSLFAGAAMVFAFAGPANAQEAVDVAAALPGGATTLQETHGDWQVVCIAQPLKPACGMTQEQVDQQNRQWVLAAELRPVGDAIEGILLLPFGLALAQGVALQIDDLSPGQSQPFRTCLPGGCVVPVRFDAQTATALRAGATLKIAVVLDNEQPTQFSLSLKGFSSALDRTAALGN